jgi:purine nucleosidase
MPRPLLIDSDPGCDDALAILLAFASPELEVRGISTVMGNTQLPRITENALKLCELAGRADVPVYSGCSQPLLQTLDTAEIVHGADAMAELDLPSPSAKPSHIHAVDWIVDSVLAAPAGTMTLCALGPLTNVALAFAKDRRVAPRLRELVIMGGSFFAGGNSNAVPVAESNIVNDPHAARIVFESGAAITLAPLDLTHRNLATPARIAAFRGRGRIAEIAADIMTFYSRYDVEKMGLPGGPIHDPCTIAWLIAPELFQSRRIHAGIETMSETTLGMTVGDWWHATGKTPNVTVLHDLDSDGFYSLLADRLASL